MASIDAAASGADAAFFATDLHAGAWFNLDLIWSAALVATGTLTLMVWGTERMRQSFGAERKLDRIESHSDALGL